MRQAVTEITQVARTERIEAAEGAVTFIERLSPALENVDSSSGACSTRTELTRFRTSNDSLITNTMRAARNAGGGDEVRARIRALVRDAQPRSDFIAEIISRCAAQDSQ